MSDTIGFQPIVNGITQVVNEIVAQVTLNGTVAYIPVYEPFLNGALISSGNTMPVADAGAILNLGSINSGQVSLVSQGTSGIAQNASMIAQLGSINTILTSGSVPILDKPGTYNLRSLAGSGVLGASGTAVTVLAAGNCTAGGILSTTNAAGFTVNQNGSAVYGSGTSDSIPIQQYQVYQIIPTTGAVSVVSSFSGLVLNGYGFV